MATKASKTSKTKPAQAASCVQVAHLALLPLFVAMQDRSAENQAIAGSRSSAEVKILCTLWDASTDRKADGIALLGDGEKGTKKAAGVKGTLADELVKKYAEKLSVSVRGEISQCRKVYANLGNPAMRAIAEKSGIRAAYDSLKATPEAKDAGAGTTTKVGGTAMERAVAILSEPDGFDALYAALRGYFLKASDSIGVSKLAEIELHMMAKTKKTA
jgi:hypothetical protein